MEYLYDKPNKKKIDSYFNAIEEKIKKQELPLIVLDWRIEFTASIKKITEQII
jgi:hypothetical protein